MNINLENNNHVLVLFRQMRPDEVSNSCSDLLDRCNNLDKYGYDIPYCQQFMSSQFNTGENFFEHQASKNGTCFLKNCKNASKQDQQSNQSYQSHCPVAPKKQV